MPSYQLKTGHSDHVYIHVNLLPRDWLIRNWCGVRNEQVSLIKFYVSDSLKIKKTLCSAATVHRLFSDVETHSICDLRFQVLVGHGGLDSLPLIQHVLQLLSFQSCAFASLLFGSHYSE